MSRGRRSVLRRDWLRTCGTAGLTGIAGCLSESSEPVLREGFEDGIGNWEADAAIGPEVDLDEFEWEVNVSDEEATGGNHSLRIWNEGSYDDGTTWAVHPVSGDPEQAYRMNVSAQFWSEGESFNLIRSAVMRLGPDRPAVEEDFPAPGQNTTEFGETPYGGLREPLWLAEGWHEYSFEWTTPALSTDTLYLAVGTSVVWETNTTHYVDDIVIEAESR